MDRIRLALAVPLVVVAMMLLATADLVGGVRVQSIIHGLKLRRVYPLLVWLTAVVPAHAQLCQIRAVSDGAVSIGTCAAVQVMLARSTDGDPPGTLFITAGHVVPKGSVSVRWKGHWRPSRLAKTWGMNRGDLALVFTPNILAERTVTLSTGRPEPGTKATVYAYPQGCRTLRHRRDAILAVRDYMYTSGNTCRGQESGGVMIRDGTREVIGIHSGCDRSRSLAFFGMVSHVALYLRAVDPRCGCPLDPPAQPATPPQVPGVAERDCAECDCAESMAESHAELAGEVVALSSRLRSLRTVFSSFRSTVIASDIPGRVGALEANCECTEAGPDRSHGGDLSELRGPPGERGPAGPSPDIEAIVASVLARLPKAPVSYQIVPKPRKD